LDTLQKLNSEGTRKGQKGRRRCEHASAFTITVSSRLCCDLQENFTPAPNLFFKRRKTADPDQNHSHDAEMKSPRENDTGSCGSKRWGFAFRPNAETITQIALKIKLPDKSLDQQIPAPHTGRRKKKVKKKLDENKSPKKKKKKKREKKCQLLWCYGRTRREYPGLQQRQRDRE
jgi:hypothetical protein